jgi:CubicO group peptidase (beta-lactamase class C family)
MALNKEAHDRRTASGGSHSEESILDADEGNQSPLEKLVQIQSSDKSIHSILAELGTPYASIGVLSNNSITAKVLGAPETSSSTPWPNTETLFQAASISKPLTAIAVIKLCQEGKLDLDASISAYLGSDQLLRISTPKTLPLVKQVTLRHLLSHTSGLSCGGFMGYPTSDIPTIEQILRGEPPANNENITMSFLPGQSFQYSGGGFTVVQFILETHFKNPFHQIMDEVLLVSLDMTRSTFRFLPAEEKNYAPAYINGLARASPEYHFFAESAAAGLWTTPTDLLKVIQAMQRSLKVDDFLERKWAREMLTEVGAATGIGWRARKGEVHFGHMGSNDPGYFCYVGGYASLPTEDGEESERKQEIPEGCGFCVMTSSMLGLKVIDKIAAAIAYLEEWPAIPELISVPFMDFENDIDEEVKEWCGNWGPGEWKLSVDDDGTFVVRFGDSPATPLVPGAVPTKYYEEGKSFDLVVDGLEVMLRLGWKDKARVIEVWQEGGVATIERTPSTC